MKPLLLIIFIVILSAPKTCTAQRAVKATQQKTFAGKGGVFMNYIIELKTRKDVLIEIDSIKTIADTSIIPFSFLKDAGKISFGFPIAQPEKCRTCPDTDLKPVNTTKGVVIYGTNGNRKFSLKVKKFKELPDLKTP